MDYTVWRDVTIVHSRAFVHILSAVFQATKNQSGLLETFEKYSTVQQHTRPLVQLGLLQCVNDGPVQ